jgi:uncharacterized membrane protein YhaH (DUF805 family)
MGYFSLWHWVILLIPLAIAVFVIWMSARVLRKAGYSGWWVLVMIVPVVNLIMLWVFAFSDWPALRSSASRPTTRP